MLESSVHRAREGAPLSLALGLASIVLMAMGTGCSDEAQTCERSNDCSSSAACVEGTCQTITCRTNLDCPADAICFPGDDGDSGRCAAQQCRTDGDCERDFPFCVNGRCVVDEPAECVERRDCGDGERCFEENCTTVPDNAVCFDNEDCGNPKVCDPTRGSSGECVDPCESNADCEGDDGLQACDTTPGLCFAVECLADEDCSDDQICNDLYGCEFERFPCDELDCTDPSRPFETEPLNGECRCVECLSDNNCADTAPISCPTVESCLCTDANRCLGCDVPADGASECIDDLPFFREGCCVECLGDVDCEPLGLGSVCQAGGCAVCDCLAGCECPGDAVCSDQGDGTGRCQRPLGQLGDECFAQDDCESFLACNYGEGICVAQGTASLCGTGCEEPLRCGAVTNGAFCFGCDPDNDLCPDSTTCVVRDEWEGVFDGGRCDPI